MLRKTTLASLLLYSVFLQLFSPFAVSAQKPVRGKPIKTKPPINQILPNGLQFRLSDGEEGAENRIVKPKVIANPMSDGETSNLLKRIPPIKEIPADKTDFAKRAGSLPAPKVGKKIEVKFPADEQINPPNADQSKLPLEVVRYSPEGEVPLAPDLSVTFSQPMVAVTSQTDAAATVPIELTPKTEGKWRWLGTKTLMFDSAKRFPMATRFTARVPAGTKSANGQTLKTDFIWSFATPPPKVEGMFPKDQITRRDALVFVSFDQEINAEAVLKTIKVSGGGKNLPIRLATQDEIEKDSSISYYITQTQPNRWLAFRAVNTVGLTENALPADSRISVVIEKGTASAEGEITTKTDQTFGFQTFGAMKLVEGWCRTQGNRNCTPNETWYMQFTNSIDTTTFNKEMVKVDPPIEGLSMYPSGNYIYIQGIKKGKTSYKVTVDNSIKDSFGQSLEGGATVTFKVGEAEKNLYSQGGNFVVLDPNGNPSYSIYSINYEEVKLKIYRVVPQDWQAFRQFKLHQNYDEQTRPKAPGKLIVDKIQKIESLQDELTETRLDLSEVLNDGFGNAIIVVEPVTRKDKYDRTEISTWCQSTNIGLDAFVDAEELVGFATEMRTGKPLSNVELSIFPNGTEIKTARNESGKSWWELLSSWGISGESIGETEIIDSNGEVESTELIGEAKSNSTTENGILRLPLPDSQQKMQNILIAKKGKDIAFLPENSDNYYYNNNGSWYKKGLADSARWFVFDDRKMYRPKEEVSVKGYIRTVEGGKLGDVSSNFDRESKVYYRLMDSQNNEILKGETNLNAFGAFDFKIKLTDTMNLGNVSLDMDRDADLSYPDYTHNFRVEEFRRPEFEVTTKVNSEAPHFVGGQAELSVEAKYYSGGGLANAEANWTVTASPTNYTPPNRDDFTFGKWIPWWRNYGYQDYGNTSTQTFKGVTNSSGIHKLKMDFESANPSRPYTLTASASVQDVNRQTWSSYTSLLVHSADLYVGIRTNRTFVQKNENIEVESIVSDIDGKLTANRDVAIKAILKNWAFDKGAWKEETIDEQTCEIKSSEKPEKCKFTAKAGGIYAISAKVSDDKERLNESEITVWVAGGKTPPKRNVEQEEVNLIPSKKDFVPGDVAEILVQSPFFPAEGVLTLRRGGIVKTERFTMKESTTTLKIPLDSKYLPNIYAQVDLVGVTDRLDDKGEIDPKLEKRPAFASGSLNLPISYESRKLKVSAEPQAKTLQPGGTTKIDVAVTDNVGEPVTNTEVAVVVVDESVLALTGYRVGNPADTFYAQRGAGVTDYHLRKDILLGNPRDIKQLPSNLKSVGYALTLSEEVSVTSNASIAGSRSDQANITLDGADVNSLPLNGRNFSSMLRIAPGTNAEPNPESQIALRQNFDALALFAPNVTTDSSGKATVDIKLPDNLTRYRVVAVAVDSGKRFGLGESNLTAKQPLMVRPSAPRFMNFGDKIELPVVVQNQTENALTVDVGVRATNATLTAGGGRKVTIAANDRAEVRFPVSAEKAGTARFQIAVSSGNFSDAAEVSLPVWTPATSEAFATYGTTDANGAIVQPVQTPGDVWSQFGGLEVTTSSTQLQELTDSFLYLYRYPYECSEQISSRMISVSALRDVLKAFKTKGMPTDDEIESSFRKDIEILKGRQRDDGSFGLWGKAPQRYEFPFMSVHVAHALGLAKAKGYKVPDGMIEKSKRYLQNVEKYFVNDEPQEVRWAISAYALYVRDLLGDKDPSKTKNLLKEATIEKMPFEALGWILSVLADDEDSTEEVAAITRFLMNRTTETAAAANFVTNYGDGGWLIMYSNRRADGVLLEALLKTQDAAMKRRGDAVIEPKSDDLIPKLVRGLLAHRTKGAWSNTQENVFILLALDKCFQAYEKVTPDFVTKIWLGNTYAGEEIFKGRSVDSNQLNIPMSYLMDQGGKSNLIIDKQGAGRLYYRIGMQYAPKNLKLAPADYGFTVLRRYEAVDSPEDVKQNSDGIWTIKSGARVRVKLTMVAQSRRYHVALVDPLPAGLEILNPDLAVTEAIPEDKNDGNSSLLEYGSRSYGRGYWYWRSQWFEHQNFRDERAEAFSSLLWEGVYNYTYVARATTPGQFVVPPTKAEEMYHPETFGRTGTDFVNVE
jgi:alpha-2-macroglobulin